MHISNDPYGDVRLQGGSSAEFLLQHPVTDGGAQSRPLLEANFKWNGGGIKEEVGEGVCCCSSRLFLVEFTETLATRWWHTSWVKEPQAVTAPLNCQWKTVISIRPPEGLYSSPRLFLYKYQKLPAKRSFPQINNERNTTGVGNFFIANFCSIGESCSVDNWRYLL